MLEKALASNPSFLPAAYLLVDILMKARHFEAAIVLLVIFFYDKYVHLFMTSLINTPSSFVFEMLFALE